MNCEPVSTLREGSQWVYEILSGDIDAIRAAVDLRGAHFHEMNEAVLEAGFGDIFFESIHGLLGFLGVSPDIDSWFHTWSPS
jgi:hypothetical protein